jgi:D-arabinose 1-dehydrogenase-like Zn-dependent alcohol dehydrogenase
MRKGILALIVVAAFIAGAAAGFGGGYYKYVAAPRKQAVEMAKKQQEEMNKMSYLRCKHFTLWEANAHTRHGRFPGHRTGRITNIWG